MFELIAPYPGSNNLLAEAMNDRLSKVTSPDLHSEGAAGLSNTTLDEPPCLAGADSKGCIHVAADNVEGYAQSARGRGPPARKRVPKITQSDLDKIVALAKSLELEVAEVEITPVSVRLVTAEGRGLTVSSQEDLLDRELADFRGRQGYSSS